MYKMSSSESESDDQFSSDPSDYSDLDYDSEILSTSNTNSSPALIQKPLSAAIPIANQLNNANGTNHTISCHLCDRQIFLNEYQSHIAMHNLLDGISPINKNAIKCEPAPVQNNERSNFKFDPIELNRWSLDELLAKALFYRADIVEKTNNIDRESLIGILSKVAKNEKMDSTQRRSLRKRKIKTEKGSDYVEHLSDFSGFESSQSSNNSESEWSDHSDSNSSSYSNSESSEADYHKVSESTNNGMQKNQKIELLEEKKPQQPKGDDISIMSIYNKLFTPKQEPTSENNIKYEIPFKILNIPFECKPVNDSSFRLLDNVGAKEEKLGINDIKSGRLLPVHSKRRDPKNEKYKTFEELKSNNFTKEQRELLAKKRKKRYLMQKAKKPRRSLMRRTNWQCLDCDEEFSDAKLFELHSIEMHDNRYCFECDECEKSYTSKENLKYHIEKIHDEVIKYHCKKCRRPFYEKNEWIQHSKTCTASYYILDCMICEDVNLTFDSHPKYKEHMMEVHSISQPYQCIHCLPDDVRYSCQGALNGHWRRDHLLMRPYKCHLCPSEFYERSILEKHQRVHDGKKPFQCSHCGMRFSQRSSWKQHIRAIHMKIRNHQCSYCDKSFASKTTLKGHMSAIHGDGVWARFECEICGKRFYEKGRYFKHKENAHAPKDPIKEMIKRGECIYPGCDKKYFSKNCRESVKYHLVAAHKDRRYAKYECKKCDKLFYDKTSYREHKEKKHGK